MQRHRRTTTLAGGLALLTALAAPASALRSDPLPLCHGHTATIVGTPADEGISGTSGPDVIVSGAGDDNIYAGGGDDVVCAGPGADHLLGDDGDDLLDGQIDKPYYELGGILWVTGDTFRGGRGDDRIIGGEDIYQSEQDPLDRGIESVSYDMTSSDVTVDLARQEISSPTLGTDHVSVNIESVDTGEGDDVIRPVARDVDYRTGGGRDRVTAGSGNNDIDVGPLPDIVDTGDGHDTLTLSRAGGEVTLGPGDDRVELRGPGTLHAGPGQDLVWLSRLGRGVHVNGGLGVDGTDISVPDSVQRFTWDMRSGAIPTMTDAWLRNVENVEGPVARTTIFGTDGPNDIMVNGEESIVRARGGSDRVADGLGRSADRLAGGPGRDELDGNGRRDRLDGGPGRDRADGGNGRDTCLRAETVQRCELP